MTSERLTAHQRFTDDMEAVGFEVEHYHGRYRWHGPAVVVRDRHEPMRFTEVGLQCDQMGLSWVVYPVASESDREGCRR